MMEFTGRERIAAGADEVFQKLTDLDFVQGGVPDLVSAERVGDELRCRVRPGVSFLKGTLDVAFRIANSAPPTATMTVQGKGIGASLAIETTMHVRPSEDGRACDVEWTSRVTQLGGLLKAVSKGLIEGLAQKVSRQTWDGLRRRLEAKTRDESGN